MTKQLMKDYKYIDERYILYKPKSSSSGWLTSVISSCVFIFIMSIFGGI